MQAYEREFAQLSPAEQEATMEMMTSWKREGKEEGKQEGRQEGKEELVARQIRRRFGPISSQILKRLDHLSSEQLDELGEALFDFSAPADLENWLSRLNSK